MSLNDKIIDLLPTVLTVLGTLGAAYLAYRYNIFSLRRQINRDEQEIEKTEVDAAKVIQEASLEVLDVWKGLAEHYKTLADTFSSKLADMDRALVGARAEARRSEEALRTSLGEGESMREEIAALKAEIAELKTRLKEVEKNGGNHDNQEA